MRLQTRHIITRTIVILMMMILGVPCSLKRDIKQALNLPVEKIALSAKANSGSICQVETNKRIQQASIAQQKLVLLQDGTGVPFPIRRTLDAFQYQKSFGATVAFSIIPIYILHEQYRI